jgi:hypothetical protein
MNDAGISAHIAQLASSESTAGDGDNRQLLLPATTTRTISNNNVTFSTAASGGEGDHRHASHLGGSFCAKVRPAQKPPALNAYLCKASEDPKNARDANGLWVP